MRSTNTIQLSLKRLFLLFLCIQLCIGSSVAPDRRPNHPLSVVQTSSCVEQVPRGGGWIPAGYNPFGYKITQLGEQYLSFHAALDGDVGRFLASLKTRKSKSALKAQWIEIVKVSKTGQTMRIYRTLDDFLKFCVAAGLIN